MRIRRPRAHTAAEVSALLGAWDDAREDLRAMGVDYEDGARVRTHDERGGYAIDYGGGYVCHLRTCPAAPSGYVWWWDGDTPQVAAFYDGVTVGGDFIPWAEVYPPEWRTDSSTGERME